MRTQVGKAVYILQAGMLLEDKVFPDHIVSTYKLFSFYVAIYCDEEYGL